MTLKFSYDIQVAYILAEMRCPKSTLGLLGVLGCKKYTSVDSLVLEISALLGDITSRCGLLLEISGSPPHPALLHLHGNKGALTSLSPYLLTE